MQQFDLSASSELVPIYRSFFKSNNKLEDDIDIIFNSLMIFPLENKLRLLVRLSNYLSTQIPLTKNDKTTILVHKGFYDILNENITFELPPCTFTKGILIQNINIGTQKNQDIQKYGEIINVGGYKHGKPCLYDVLYIDSKKNINITQGLKEKDFEVYQSWKGLNINLESFKPIFKGGLKGGFKELSDIIAEIHNTWGIIHSKRPTNSLGFKCKDISHEYMNFIVTNKPDMYKAPHKPTSPLYKYIGYSLFYEIQRLNNELNNYLMKIFEKKKTLHDFEYDTYRASSDKNILIEFNRYIEYMPIIYYYGDCTLHKTKSDSVYQYVIYKSYYSLDKMNATLTTKQKYSFLINNLDMLIKIYNDNCFITNFDINSIGWESYNKMNVKFIDYNYFSISNISHADVNLETSGENIRFWSSTGPTLVPNYFKNESTGRLGSIGPAKISQYNKFSIPGLINLIKKLDIQISPPIIRDTKEIETIDQIISYLKLDSYNYDEVSDYSTIKTFFNTIPEYNRK